MLKPTMLIKELSLTDRISLRQLIFFSLQLYYKNFRKIIKNLSLFFIPVIAVFACLGLPLYNRLSVFFFNIASNNTSVYSALTDQLGHEAQFYTGIFTLLVHLICIFSQSSVMICFHNILLDVPDDELSDPLGGVLRRLIPLTGSYIIGLTIVILTGILSFWVLAIPMWMTVILLLFITPGVVLEDKFYFSAVKRSINLAKNHILPMAGFLLFMGLLAFIIRLITGIPFLLLPYSPELSAILIKGNSIQPDIALVRKMISGYYISLFLKKNITT